MSISNSSAWSWSYGAWDTSEYRVFIYNGLGQVVCDSSIIYWSGGIWQPNEKWLYNFDATGNLISAEFFT